MSMSFKQFLAEYVDPEKTAEENKTEGNEKRRQNPRTMANSQASEAMSNKKAMLDKSKTTRTRKSALQAKKAQLLSQLTMVDKQIVSIPDEK